MENYLIDELNCCAKSVEKNFRFLIGESGETTKNEVRFYQNFNLNKAVEKLAPYLKVVLLCKEKTFLNKGKKIVDELKSFGNKTISCLVPNDFEFGTFTTYGAFNLAEDVRAVVVLEQDLYEFALYFATIRRIGVLFVTDCLYPEIFSAKIFVPNGQSIDKFKVDVERAVVLDNFDGVKNKAYALAMQFSLYEFLAFDCVNNNTKNLYLTDYIKARTLGLNPINLFEIYYLNLLSNGAILKDCSITELSLLRRKKFEANQLLTTLTNAVLESVSESEEVIDYNNLAEKICLVTNESLICVIKRIRKQLEVMKDKKETILRAKSQLLTNALRFLQELKKTNILEEISKDNNEKTSCISKVCGYSLGVNIFTLANEKIYK